MNIYESYVEVIPLEGAEMPAEFKGAFVNCYISSESFDVALSYLKKILINDRYEIIEINYLRKVDLNDWKEVENYPTCNELEEILKKQSLLYGPFFLTKIK